MVSLSLKSSENSITKKKIKVHRSSQKVSNKIVAFHEFLSLDRKRSKREISSLLEVPNSTMQSWIARKPLGKLPPEVEVFFSTPVGIGLLNRIVMAAYQTIHFGCGGIRSVQEFLRLSKLSEFVASSEGALHSFSVRCEEHIVSFAKTEEKKLSGRMGKRKVTAALDEMFRGRHPCLVAIELRSNYILLEKFTDDRKAETWSAELKPRLDDLNLELNQVVSDQGTGICSCSKDLGAQHIPELFHAQHELTKATSAPLAAQEREFKTNLAKTEEKLSKIIKKHDEKSEKTLKIVATRNLSEHGHEIRKGRCIKVREAKKELGRVHHPIDLNTGKLQTAEQIKEGFDLQLGIIEACAKEADLSSRSQKRLVKARRTFDSIVSYVTYFFMLYAAFVKDLELNKDQEQFFHEVIFPLCYLKVTWRRLPKKERDKLKLLKEDLERRFDEAIYSEDQKKIWMKEGEECAGLFQRSSSCVEGRNGMLSLYYHRFHRLNIRSLKALTVVHNFHIERSDNTTAAERLFGAKHQNLFESLLEKVRIPGRSRKQHHDPQKRLIGREKRVAA